MWFIAKPQEQVFSRAHTAADQVTTESALFLWLPCYWIWPTQLASLELLLNRWRSKVIQEQKVGRLCCPYSYRHDIILKLKKKVFKCTSAIGLGSHKFFLFNFLGKTCSLLWLVHIAKCSKKGVTKWAIFYWSLGADSLGEFETTVAQPVSVWLNCKLKCIMVKISWKKLQLHVNLWGISTYPHTDKVC